MGLFQALGSRWRNDAATGHPFTSPSRSTKIAPSTCGSGAAAIPAHTVARASATVIATTRTANVGVAVGGGSVGVRVAVGVREGRRVVEGRRVEAVVGLDVETGDGVGAEVAVSDGIAVDVDGDDAGTFGSGIQATVSTAAIRAKRSTTA